MNKKEVLKRYAGRDWAGSKGEALLLFKAVKNHKKLPTFDRKFKKNDSAYKKLTIEEYEKKYGI